MAEPENAKGKELYEDLPSDLPPPAFDEMLRPRRQLKVGFECEFVESPRELQTECPICLHVLREPHQATCCGYIYCHRCIERVKMASKPCPTCNSTDFSIFADKRLHKSLYNFKVWCSKRDEGCNWSDELRNLTAHLNAEPIFDRRLIGCDYVKIECSLCHEFMKRKALQNHESVVCVFRPYSCEYCRNFQSTYKEVTEKHQPECPLMPVSCPNQCGMDIVRQNLNNHCKNECEKRLPDKIPCEFGFAGCTEMIPPDEMQLHLDNSLRDHLSLLATSHLSLRKRLMELQSHFDENNLYVERLQKEKREMQEQFLKETQGIRELRAEFDKMKMKQESDSMSIESLQNYSSILPIVFTLDDYEGRKGRGDMGWSSLPFYTHLHGYRMSLWVDIGGNGPGKGIYISVFLSLTKGEHDQKLKWPFRGSVIVQLLNQRDDELSHTEVIKYHDHTPPLTAGRVMEEGRMSKPWGKGKFMKHEELRNAGFVKNDTLKFRVSTISGV